jgi:uncharacterized protein YidB (DUF937 family)
MGLLDEILKQAAGGGQAGGAGGGQGSALGSIAELVMKNPQIMSAAISMLSSHPGSVGGSGGLGGLIGAFEKAGLGSMMSSWISTGPNPPIQPGQLTSVLGNDTLNQFAQKAGIDPGQASSILASVLPALIDHLTPNGQVPQTSSLESTLGSLLGGLGR